MIFWKITKSSFSFEAGFSFLSDGEKLLKVLFCLKLWFFLWKKL